MRTGGRPRGGQAGKGPRSQNALANRPRPTTLDGCCRQSSRRQADCPWTGPPRRPRRAGWRATKTHLLHSRASRRSVWWRVRLRSGRDLEVRVRGPPAPGTAPPPRPGRLRRVCRHSRAGQGPPALSRHAVATVGCLARSGHPWPALSSLRAQSRRRGSSCADSCVRRPEQPRFSRCSNRGR